MSELKMTEINDHTANQDSQMSGSGNDNHDKADSQECHSNDTTEDGKEIIDKAVDKIDKAK